MTREFGIKEFRWSGLAVASILLLSCAAWGRNPDPSAQSDSLNTGESLVIPVPPASLFDLSSDGRVLAAGETQGPMSIIDATSGATLRALNNQNLYNLSMLRFSPDGTLLAAEFATSLAIWDVQSGALLRTIPKAMTVVQNDQQPVEVQSLAFSPDGHVLAAGESAATMAIKLFDVTSGTVIRSWQAGPEAYGGVGNLTFAPGGRYLFSNQGSEPAKEWDTRTGMLVRIFQGSLPYWNSHQAAAFSPDGSRLALTGHRQVEIVDLSSGSVAQVVAKDVDGEPLGFTADGRQLMVLLDSEPSEGADRTHDVGVWDVASGQQVKLIRLGTYNDYSIREVLFSSRSGSVVSFKDKQELSITPIAGE